MSTATSVDVNGLTVNQELPQQRAGAGTIYENMTTVQSFPHLEFFPKTYAVALGTVQIMTGIVIVLLGIVIEFNAYTIAGDVTWIVYWGPLIFIVAGSLTIAAENKLSPCLVKGFLGMNVISAITAGIAIFLLMVDVFIVTLWMNDFEYDHYNSSASQDWGSKDCAFWVYLFDLTLFITDFIQLYLPGINGVLEVFFLLQFIMSICLSAFACKTMTYCDLSVSITSL
ncbi:membrane-spanning 4-domains subfamily A member 12-like [Misgurnus anguillicaudatus]|uniref:membrane-spanning 4-domains subfamily A member 12-like n=1 Tax=Misgurnus anguillicaudatus TaxID=75329 RepID=UPI003CCF4805